MNQAIDAPEDPTINGTPLWAWELWWHSSAVAADPNREHRGTVWQDRADGWPVGYCDTYLAGDEAKQYRAACQEAQAERNAYDYGK